VSKEERIMVSDEWVDAMKATSIAELLKEVPLFEELSLDDLETMSPLFIERKYKKGTILFFEGDPGDDFFIIKSGLVKIYRIDEFKEIILALFREGDFFGDMALIHKQMKRSATAETLEPTTLYVLQRSEFSRFLVKCPQLALKLLETLAERLSKANEQIEDLTFLDVRTRIYKMILRLADEYGIRQMNKTVVNIKLTHQQVANMVGTVRESVTKVYLELQDENIIAIRNKMITILDMKRLQDKLSPGSSGQNKSASSS